jgi:hypothetical protein
VKNWPEPVVETEAAPRTPQRGGSIVVTAVTVTLGLLTLSLVSGSHIIFALVAIPIVVMMAWTNPVAMLGVLPIWMILMGLVRRITPGGGNVTFSGDPVLIIGPIALMVLTAVVITRRESGTMSKLARVVMAFDVVAFLEAFNPKQGSLLTGVGGLLFVLIPTMAFWVGRHYAEVKLILSIIWTVAIMGLVSALYGLYQQFVGFPTWDYNWIQTKAYTALNIGGNGSGNVVRAFSFFSSAEEYAVFLSVAAVAWVALMGKATRWPMPMHVTAFVIVMVALFYESQRTSFFLVFFALGVMAASRIGMRPINVGLAGAAAIGLLIVFAGALGGGGGGGTALSGTESAAQILAAHQLGGDSDPTGASSSLKGHISQTKKGFIEGFKEPVGHGTGSINLAATHYTTNNQLHGTEFDLGNMGIAFGVPGIVVYLLLVFFAFQMAYRLAVRRRDAIGLFVIGITAATLMQWTNGDLYSVCWLIWLFLGFGEALTFLSPASEPPGDEAPPAPSSWAWRQPGDPPRTRMNW